jgi:hypothetical protein
MKIKMNILAVLFINDKYANEINCSKIIDKFAVFKFQNQSKN